MKILNQNIADRNDIVLSTTKVSELEPLKELYEDSLIHIVDQGRESKKLTIGSFKEKIYEAVQNTFKTKYIDTHEHSEDKDHGWAFNEMVAYVGDDMEELDVGKDSNVSFVQHVNYDFEILRKYVVKKDKEITEKLDEIEDSLWERDCQFAPRMVLSTTNENMDVVINKSWSESTENDMYCQMQIKVGNKISNEWLVPASGTLVICGWLDSEKVLSSKAIPMAYCAIEGKINNGWEVIGVQPVIPAKSITYVGFTLPVKKHLVIRARTGFVVGAKSGQFANDQDGVGSLSNSIPNGFRCIVYSQEKEIDE